MLERARRFWSWVREKPPPDASPNAMAGFAALLFPYRRMVVVLGSAVVLVAWIVQLVR